MEIFECLFILNNKENFRRLRLSYSFSEKRKKLERLVLLFLTRCLRIPQSCDQMGTRRNTKMNNPVISIACLSLRTTSYFLKKQIIFSDWTNMKFTPMGCKWKTEVWTKGKSEVKLFMIKNRDGKKGVGQLKQNK